MSKIRFKSAFLLAKFAGLISRQILRKSGETIPGYVLMRIAPGPLKVLSQGKRIVLVSGTNGKTSTTKVLVGAASTLEEVATSTSGSNLARGAATALMSSARLAILEVDELHLPGIITQTNPEVVLLLNLSRDQLHRMHEVKRVADRWHEAASKAQETIFVIDVDDPFLNYATKDSKKVIKVSFGGRRHPDGSVCPSCGRYMNWNGGIYDCQCGLNNKVSDQLYPDGSAAYRNATLANVAAGLLGAPPLHIDEKALERSVTKDINGVEAEIRLTKNPASWTEALKGVDTNYVILILNARQVDGIDTSWLWDVSFASLKGKKVVVCGERALDMAYRLHVEGIESQVVENIDQATKQFEKGQKVNVLAAYTAFFGLVNK
jgi:UDP-N-acetylmuramyl tripeptide synthase